MRPVKNMISVARNSQIATLPGVKGGAWTVGRGHRASKSGRRDRSCGDFGHDILPFKQK